MTRRERLENKLTKREAWAGKRRAKASAVYAFTEQFHGDHAFNTQPGAFPLRTRVNRMEERAHEDTKMAQHHDSKASGLADQLDRSVFSDDDNAGEALRARIAEHEAQRERAKTINREIRRGAGWEARLSPSLSDKERADLLSIARAFGGAYKPGYPPYHLTNLGARIRADKERIVEIERRTTRTAEAESMGGVLIEGDDAWVRVTFAENPGHAILDALKTAGFRWGDGSWIGERAKLPAEVQA